MLNLYIENVDRTADLLRDSVKITGQLQQRADVLGFTLFQGSKPAYYDDVKLYMGAFVASAVGSTVVLQPGFTTGTNKFFTGQTLFVKVGTAQIFKVIVSTYVESR